MAAALAACLLVAAGCGEKEETIGSSESGPPDGGQSAERLSGTLRIDGPEVLSTLAHAAARNFELGTAVEVKAEDSGTGTALEKLCTGRIAVAGARRSMTESERDVCKARHIGFERIKIANQAVAVVASHELGIRCLTVRELRDLWRPGSSVTRYRQLDARLPAAPVDLYGPRIGRDDFALFTRLVNGRAGAVRGGWTTAANSDALTARVERSSHALGFYNVAELKPILDVRLIEIDAGEGCVRPSKKNVQSGRYPLREDLFLYVSKPALKHLRVRSFMQNLVENYDQLAAQAPPISPATEREIAKAERHLPEAALPQ